MKVSFQWGMPAVSGKVGNLIFWLHKRSGKVYARKRTKVAITENHHKMGSVARNLFAIKPSEGFKQDCRRYGDSLAKLPGKPRASLYSWSTCYLHLMYKLAKAYPGLDLASLTRAQIYDQNLPCISIQAAVEAGLLEPVKDYERLTALI